MSQNEAPYEYTKDENELIALNLYSKYIESTNSIKNITHSGIYTLKDDTEFKKGFVAGVKFVCNILNDMKK